MATFTLPGGQVVNSSGGDINRLARASLLQKQMQDFPGRAPGGTGPTGLLSNDARGWSNMLNEQSEYAGLMSDKPMSYQEAPYRERHVSAQPTTGTESTLFDLDQRSAVPGAPGYDMSLRGLLAAAQRKG